MPDVPKPTATGTEWPKNTTGGQAKSGRWWVQCTRTTGCTFYSSCLPTKQAALEVARIHANTHDHFTAATTRTH